MSKSLSLLAAGGATQTLSRFRVALEIALWRQGWVWLFTAIFLLGAGSAAVFSRLSLEREAAALAEQGERLARLERDIEARRAAGQSAESQASAKIGQAADTVAKLSAVLVPANEASRQVRHIYELAAKQQVTIAQADFSVDADRVGAERLQMSIPTKAGYPQLRKFLELCLRELPNASLDKLSFKRPQVGEAQVEARVQLSLWLKPGGDAAASLLEPARTSEARP